MHVMQFTKITQTAAGVEVTWYWSDLKPDLVTEVTWYWSD